MKNAVTRSHRALLALWLAGASVACTDPVYSDDARDAGDAAVVPKDSVDGGEQRRRDAGSGPEDDALDGMIAEPDTGAQLEAGDIGPAAQPEAGQGVRLDAPQAELLGLYAAKIYNFTESELTIISRGTGIARVEIVENAGELELILEPCDTEVRAYETATIVPVHSGKYPVSRQRITFDGSTWSTAPSPLGIGYERAVPERCRGHENTAVEKDPSQKWITGATCTCPAYEAAPPGLDDCRVADPDEDGQPGYTMAITFDLVSTVSTDIHVVFDDSSYFVHGQVTFGGVHKADQVFAEQAYQLSCYPRSCGDLSTSLTRPTPCSPRHNPVFFVPLEKLAPPSADGWTCEAIRSKREELFSSLTDPSWPENCPD